MHVFSDKEILAIETALAARRALLVRGEPGIGKTQLAKAAAVVLRRAFVSFVVDSRSESRDLLWYFDAVARLADAQVYGALLGRRGDAASPGSNEAEILKDLRAKLETDNFIHPRALWWGLNWKSAVRQAQRAMAPIPTPLKADCDPANGVVVLIDEIDKADAEVPNGLLEALGAGEFSVAGKPTPVRSEKDSVPPLVIITTNEERTLPDAFVRRCVVLQLRLPDARQELIEHLVGRGRAHFPNTVDTEVLTQAASMLAEDRERATERKWFPRPGQAEFMDLVRAVRELAGDDKEAQKAELARIARFALRKHLGADD